MPTRTAAAPAGAPTWIDLGTPDPDASRAFYTALFGWTIDDPGPEYGGYVNFLKDGVRVAGCMSSTDNATGGWGVYLATADAEATAAAVTAAGGTVVMPPMPVAALGSMAFVTDPGGAAIGMWQAGEHTGFGVFDEPDTPGWFELHTRSFDAAIAFYTEAFGWDAHVAVDEPGFRYTTLGEGEGQLAGVMDATAFPADAPLGWTVYFRVVDADATIAKAKDLGATVVQPAEDTPYGRLAVLTDPNGAVFKLIA